MSERETVTDWATDFDHLDQAWIENPYPIWEELREKCPIAHTERYQGVYCPVRYEDVRAVAYDPEHFSSRRFVVREGRPPIVPSPPVNFDPPGHRPHRMALLPAFTPEAVKQYEPITRALCRGLIDGFASAGGCDGATDYAQHIPVRVTAHMLGICEDAGDQFRKWIHELLEAGITDLAAFQRALEEIQVFFGEEIAKRRNVPGTDLISYLINLRVNGHPLDDARIVGTLRVLLVAGIDTTWSAIGCCLLHLATHTDDRRRLAAEPHLMPSAVEEFLRAYSPVTMAREVVKETVIDGCRFKEGEMVLLPFPAANRDPSIFPNADRVILDRAENRHAAFGLGIHRCIGAHLARMEIAVALEEWLVRIPEFQLAPGATVQWSGGPVRGPRQLPLVFG
jgi:cytochrome P450